MDSYCGINIGKHDSSICFIPKSNNSVDTEVLLSERIVKIKHKGLPPIQALNFCKVFNKNILQINSTNIAMNCFGKSAKLYESEIATNQYRELIRIGEHEKFSTLYNSEIQLIPHHKAHAYSVLAACPFEKSIIIVIDGSGSEYQAFDDNDSELKINDTHKYLEGTERETLTVYLQDHEKIVPVYKEWTEQDNEDNKDNKGTSHNLGIIFEIASKIIFGKWFHAGKVMGIAAFGTPEKYQDIFEYLIMKKSMISPIVKSKKEFDDLDKETFQSFANIAATIQYHYEKSMMAIVTQLKEKYPDYENICIVGGCALNCVFNYKLSLAGFFKNIFIPPYPSDDGISLGLATALKLKKEKFKPLNINNIHAYYGSTVNDLNKTTSEQLEDENWKLESYNPKAIAKNISNGEIFAIAIGRSEIGPRALGHRSIICSPFRKNIKQYLNDHIKFREAYRPYGIFVMEEALNDYFIINESFSSPYMNMAAKVKSSMKEKLKEVLHIDDTCRIQVVNKVNNPDVFELLLEFSKLGNPPILINSSLNIMSRPILESVSDAKLFFKKSQITLMRVGDFVLRK
jgi:carbamoyltransferase